MPIREGIKMPNLHYFRPTSIEEAIAFLDRGVPVGGGTSLIPGRYEGMGIIDLQALGLNYIQDENDEIFVGAGTKLQEVVEKTDIFPMSLINAAIQEVPLNMRNMKSGVGTLLSGE